MNIVIHLVLKTEKEANAKVVVSRLNKVLSAKLIEIERYPKGGTSVRLSKEISPMSWAEAVLRCLEVAQSFGRSWTVTGSTKDEIDLCTNEFSLSGIDWAHLLLVRKDAFNR